MNREGIRKGTCPECGSQEIYMRKGWFNNIVTVFQPPRTIVCVCGICGYIAEFVESGSHLAYIRDNWDRLELPPRKNARDDS